MAGSHTIRKFYNEKENREIGNINICQPVPHKELAAEMLDKGFSLEIVKFCLHSN